MQKIVSILVLLAAAAFSRRVVEVKPNCPRLCSLEFNPVCAYDGENYVQYGNPCLKISNDCKNKRTADIVDLSLCSTSTGLETTKGQVEPNCPRLCTQEFNPVCAYDGENYVQYGNPCLKNSNDCINNRTTDIVDLSLCSTSTGLETTEGPVEPNCSMVCTQEFNPVCAYDGENYVQHSNPCMKKSNDCINNRTTDIVDNTLCSTA